MRGKIILTRLQKLRNTDPIFYDHIIEAICEEIGNVENPYRVMHHLNPPRDDWKGFENCRRKILSLLKE